MIEHNGFTGFSADEVIPWQALVRWFAAGTADVDELVIPGVTCDLGADVPAGDCLVSATNVAAYRVDLVKLRSQGSSVDLALSANARQQLHRAMRMLAAFGPVRLDKAETVADALAYFERLKVLHVRSWSRRGRTHAFVNPNWETFHRTLIRGHAETGEVELLRLRAGKREFGYLYNFSRLGHVYAYQSGFDDADNRLRPGYVAHALAIERHCSMGDLIYDFMAGTNRLKTSFATDRYSMHWYTIQQPLLRFRAEHAARAAKSRLWRTFGVR